MIDSLANEQKFFKGKKFVENTLEISLDILDDSFIVFDEGMNISQWSKGAEIKFGFKKEEIIGKNMKELLPKDRLEESQRLIDMLTQDKVIKDYETVRLAKHGKEINLLISASPIYDEDGIFSGVAAIYKDITDRKFIEKKLYEKCEQLQLLKQEAEDANKAKSIFLANMSHEIRTPLNGILGTIQLLKLESSNEEQKKYIKMLSDSANAMLKVTNKLLDISKIESGAFEINSEPFNLKETIKINKNEQEKITVNKAELDKVILCVEDNLINQEVMESLIKRKGYKYISAYNGNEALEILDNNRVDLILMDIQMPELNGFETTKIIREKELGKHIPIIAMTAYAMREDKDKCMQAKMDDYIIKPFDVEKLYEIIECNLRE